MSMLPEDVRLMIAASQASPIKQAEQAVAGAIMAQPSRLTYLPEDAFDPRQLLAAEQTRMQMPSAYELIGLQDIEDTEAIARYAMEQGIGPTIAAGEQFVPLTLRPALEAMNQAAPHAGTAALGLGALSMMMGRGGRGRAPRMRRRQGGWIGGVESEAADLDALAKAQAMKAQGEDRNAIFKRTGWFEERGQWKYEEPDIDTAMRDLPPEAEEWLASGQKYIVPLADYYDNPSLYAAYPELSSAHVTLDPARAVTTGEMRPAIGRLPERMELGTLAPEGTPDEVYPFLQERSVLHEAQHGVQGREDFARGGTPKEFTEKTTDDILRDYDNQMKVVTQRGSVKDQVAASNYIKTREAYETYNQSLEEKYGGVMEWVEQGTPAEHNQSKLLHREWRDAANDWKYVNDYERLEAVRYAAERNRWTDTPMMQYGRLAGEAEARNVEHRMQIAKDMKAQGRTDAEIKQYLREHPPWETLENMRDPVKEQDLVYRYRSGRRVQQPQESTDYRGTHTAPVREGKNTIDDLADIFPDDIYSINAAQYYGHYGGNDPMDQQSAAIIQRMKGRPNARITVYRAVPHVANAAEQLKALELQMNKYMRTGRSPAGGGKLGGSAWYEDAWRRRAELEQQVKTATDETEVYKINPGDWITINKAYAKEHGDSNLGGNYKIIQRTVRARDIATDGNSIHEWGYDPQAKTGIELGIMREESMQAIVDAYKQHPDGEEAGRRQLMEDAKKLTPEQRQRLRDEME